MKDNQRFKQARSMKIDYADKPIGRTDWKGVILTVIAISAFLGLLAIELAVMDGSLVSSL